MYRSFTDSGPAFISPADQELVVKGNHRNILKSERAASTKLTSVLSGRPARGIVNRLISFGETEGSPMPAAYHVAYDAAKQLNAAQGGSDFAALWAGQGAPLARELPAAQLVSTLVSELLHPMQ